MLTAEAVREELSAFRARSGKPVNVNFFCHEPPSLNDRSEARWRAALQPYFNEFAIESVPPAPERKPFDHAAADAIESFQPEVISFHFGLPSVDLMARVNKWGATVCPRRLQPTRPGGLKPMEQIL